MICFEDLIITLVKYKPQMESIMLTDILINKKVGDVITYYSNSTGVAVKLPYIFKQPKFEYNFNNNTIGFCLNLDNNEDDNEIVDFCMSTLKALGINNEQLSSQEVSDKLLKFIDIYLEYIIKIQSERMNL